MENITFSLVAVKSDKSQLGYSFITNDEFNNENIFV